MSAVARNEIKLTLEPVAGGAEIPRNTVFVIKNCKLPAGGLAVSVNGEKVDAKNYRNDMVGGNLILWLGRDVTGSSVISISR